MATTGTPTRRHSPPPHQSTQVCDPHTASLCSSLLSNGCSKLQVFASIAATSFSGLICFVSASAKMQSVSTHLQTSVASLLLGKESVTIGAPIASPLHLQIACWRDAIVMPRRLSDCFPIVGRTSALRLLSQSCHPYQLDRTRRLHLPLFP